MFTLLMISERIGQTAVLAAQWMMASSSAAALPTSSGIEEISKLFHCQTFQRFSADGQAEKTRMLCPRNNNSRTRYLQAHQHRVTKFSCPGELSSKDLKEIIPRTARPLWGIPGGWNMEQDDRRLGELVENFNITGSPVLVPETTVS